MYLLYSLVTVKWNRRIRVEIFLRESSAFLFLYFLVFLEISAIYRTTKYFRLIPLNQRRLGDKVSLFKETFFVLHNFKVILGFFVFNHISFLISIYSSWGDLKKICWLLLHASVRTVKFLHNSNNGNTY